MQEKIAVVVPAKERQEYIHQCISSILALDYPNFEVIVVDDGLEKTTLDILDKFKHRLKVLQSHSGGPSLARNLATKNTDAEYIAFTDSDCIADKDWLKELSKGFREFPQAAACGGIQKLPQDAADFEKNVFLFMQKAGFISDYIRRAKNEEILEVGHNPSCNVMYKREVFLREEGFLEGLWPGEDVEFDYRLKKKGYKLCLNPKAIVYHYKPKTLKSFLKMMYRYGCAQGFLVRKYGFFRKIHFMPLLGLIIFFVLLFYKSLQLILVIGLLLLILFFKFNLYLSFLSTLGFISWNIGFLKGIVFPNILSNMGNKNKDSNLG